MEQQRQEEIEGRQGLGEMEVAVPVEVIEEHEGLENQESAENQHHNDDGDAMQNMHMGEGEHIQEEPGQPEQALDDGLRTPERPTRRLTGRAARAMTIRAMQRYNARRSRSRTRGQGRRSPNSVASSSASPDATIRSRATPPSLPPAPT